jgi:hypothetical protein
MRDMEQMERGCESVEEEGEGYPDCGELEEGVGGKNLVLSGQEVMTRRTLLIRKMHKIDSDCPLALTEFGISGRCRTRADRVNEGGGGG